MTRRKSQRRPEFESLESMELLSGIGAAGAHEAVQVRATEHCIEMAGHRELAAARHVARKAGPTPGIALNLSGRVVGMYRVVGGTSAAFTGHGALSPVGTARLQGKVSVIPGSGGELALTFAGKGKVYAVVTGETAVGAYIYRITGGTKDFAGDTGAGVATLESPLGGLRGHFALDLRSS